MKEDRVLVDSETFKFLLDAFIRSGKFDTALEILDYMEELGVGLNRSVYDSVIVALVRKDQLFEACNGNDNGNSVVSLLPGSIAINELLIAPRKADMRGEFKQVFDKLRGKKDFELDTCGYNICIHSFRCWGDLSASLILFKQMKEREKSLSFGSFGPDLCTYNSLIHMLCLVGKVKNAFVVWEELKVSGHKRDVSTYRIIIQGCSIAEENKAKQKKSRNKFGVL
ncbi:hypothetical protein CRYUN_Cryun20dG0043100 [Craigia yunnanensis]